MATTWAVARAAGYALTKTVYREPIANKIASTVTVAMTDSPGGRLMLPDDTGPAKEHVGDVAEPVAGLRRDM
jgi:hypothetical protein